MTTNPDIVKQTKNEIHQVTSRVQEKLDSKSTNAVEQNNNSSQASVTKDNKKKAAKRAKKKAAKKKKQSAAASASSTPVEEAQHAQEEQQEQTILQEPGFTQTIVEKDADQVDEPLEPIASSALGTVEPPTDNKPSASTSTAVPTTEARNTSITEPANSPSSSSSSASTKSTASTQSADYVVAEHFAPQRNDEQLGNSPASITSKPATTSAAQPSSKVEENMAKATSQPITTAEKEIPELKPIEPEAIMISKEINTTHDQAAATTTAAVASASTTATAESHAVADGIMNDNVLESIGENVQQETVFEDASDIPHADVIPHTTTVTVEEESPIALGQGGVTHEATTSARASASGIPGAFEEVQQTVQEDLPHPTAETVEIARFAEQPVRAQQPEQYESSVVQEATETVTDVGKGVSSTAKNEVNVPSTIPTESENPVAVGGTTAEHPVQEAVTAPTETAHDFSKETTTASKRVSKHDKASAEKHKVARKPSSTGQEPTTPSTPAKSAQSSKHARRPSKQASAPSSPGTTSAAVPGGKKSATEAAAPIPTSADTVESKHAAGPGSATTKPSPGSATTKPAPVSATEEHAAGTTKPAPAAGATATAENETADGKAQTATDGEAAPKKSWFKRMKKSFGKLFH